MIYYWPEKLEKYVHIKAKEFEIETLEKNTQRITLFDK